MNKDLLIMLSTLCGLTIANAENPSESELTELKAKLTAHNTKVSEDATKLINAEAEVARLKTVESEYATLKVSQPELTQLKTFSESITSKLRAATLANFTKLSNGTPKEDVVIVINSANYDALMVLNTQYETQLEEKYPLSCKACKSTDISRASAVPANEGKGNETKTDALEELLQSKQNSMGTSLIHGDIKNPKTAK